MKHKIIIILISLGVFVLNSFSYAFQNEPAGFRDIKWETDIKNLSDMRYLGGDNNVQFYEKKGDILKIGNAKLESLSYVFWKGKFAGIFADADRRNCEPLREAIIKKFGEADPLPFVLDFDKGNKYEWDGSKTIMFFFDVPIRKNDINICKLRIFSRVYAGRVADRLIELRRKEGKEEADRVKGF